MKVGPIVEEHEIAVAELALQGVVVGIVGVLPCRHESEIRDALACMSGTGPRSAKSG